jgi:hypothetical protein
MLCTVQLARKFHGSGRIAENFTCVLLPHDGLL